MSSSASELPPAFPLLCGKSAWLGCEGLWPEVESFSHDGPLENKCSSLGSLKGSDGRGMGIFSKNPGPPRSGTGMISL